MQIRSRQLVWAAALSALLLGTAACEKHTDNNSTGKGTYVYPVDVGRDQKAPPAPPADQTDLANPNGGNGSNFAPASVAAARTATPAGATGKATAAGVTMKQNAGNATAPAKSAVSPQ